MTKILLTISCVLITATTAAVSIGLWRHGFPVAAIVFSVVTVLQCMLWKTTK